MAQPAFPAKRYSKNKTLVIGMMLAGLAVVSIVALTSLSASSIRGSSSAIDPGPRPLPAAAGAFYTTLTPNQNSVTARLTTVMTEVNQVTGGMQKTVGLGPGFNSNSCTSCHAYPANGGTSPPVNPLFAIFNLFGGTNTMPFFIITNGPVLVARFVHQADGVTPDGGVHNMFNISNRTDAPGCTGLVQPDFSGEAAKGNLINRLTTPTYGEGLVELVQESDIVANLAANSSLKQTLGISGHPNYSGDDGGINRFGWKAQIRSLVYFSGEAYNVEEGNSNEMFPNERDESIPACLPPFPVGSTFHTKGVPDDRVDTGEAPKKPVNFSGDLERFGLFMRFLQPPTPVAPTPSTTNGQVQFNNVGCVLCHQTSFTTPKSSIAALSQQTATLYSDLAVHHMGPLLADGIMQGQAGPDEFRTAPLWGIGQRLFFMHDGRTADLVTAIQEHHALGNSQYAASEANAVIDGYNKLSETNQQDLLNFLRSL